MKKIVALVLAMLMVLTAVSAMAGGSKGGKDIDYGTTDANVGLINADPTTAQKAVMDKVTAAGADGAVAALAEEAPGLIPEGFNKINEMSCWKLDGDTSNLQELELIFKFATPYEAGSEVTLLVGVSPADDVVEWIKLDGKANADGDVVVKLTSAQLAKISNNPFLVIPVTK